MMPPLAPSGALAEGRPLLLHVGTGAATRRLILLRTGGVARAFLNACPHMGVTLDRVPERVLSADGRWLRCTAHGALFRREDGLCVRGPCAGERLTAVPVVERAGAVLLEDAA